jgi:hypothetical protein
MGDLEVTYENRAGCGCHGYYRPVRVQLTGIDISCPTFLFYRDPETDVTQFHTQPFFTSEELDSFLEEHDIDNYRTYNGTIDRDTLDNDFARSSYYEYDTQIVECDYDIHPGDKVYLSNKHDYMLRAYKTREEGEKDLVSYGLPLDSSKNRERGLHGYEMYELTVSY